MLCDEMNPIHWKKIFIQILIFISYIEKRCKNQEVTIIKQTSHNEDETNFWEQLQEFPLY